MSALAGVNVCVVGLNYAPEPTGSAPYTAGLAEMLTEHGADVEAIVGVPHYPTWRIDPAHRRRLRSREEINGVSVRRARHFVPARQSAVSRLLWDGTFFLNAGTMSPAKRPDLVIASTPSLSGALVGARLARRGRVPFGVVVQDLVGQAARQSGISGGGTVAAAAAKVESAALRRADQVAVVSDTFRRQVEAYGVAPGRVRLLRNWTHIAQPTRSRSEMRRALGWSEDVFVVLHTGNMGLKQDLGNVVEAARLLVGRKDVAIVLMGDGNQRAALEMQGRDVPVLSFVDPVPADSYADALRAADLLLVNEKPTVGEMSLPSKLTSYFAVGAPVLAAVSRDGACARELELADGAAKRVDPGQPAQLVAAIDTLRADDTRRGRMAANASSYAERSLLRSAASANVLLLAEDLLSRERSLCRSGE